RPAHRGRHRRQRRLPHPGGRGCGEVRQVVGRAARHRARPAGLGEGAELMAERTTVDITDAALTEAARSLLDQLVADRVASALTAQDPTLWGERAEPEASIRLSWTTLHKSSRPLIGEIEALRTDL